MIVLFDSFWYYLIFDLDLFECMVVYMDIYVCNYMYTYNDTTYKYQYWEYNKLKTQLTMFLIT